MVLLSWIKDYLKRSKDFDLVLENMTVMPWGFATYSVDGKKLILYNVYGDGKKWDKWFTELAKRLKCNRIMFATRRNPKAFQRAYKDYKLVGYVFEKEVK